jgi:Polysaccharide lyase
MAAAIRVSVVLAVLCALAFAAPASAGVLWRADAERPLLQEWANFSCASPDRVSQVSDPVAQGRSAYRVDLHDGDDSFGERCELGMSAPVKPGFPVFSEGDESWIAYQVYIPVGFPSDGNRYVDITQFKQVNDLCAPALSVHVEDGEMLLFHSADNRSSCGGNALWRAPMSYDRWVKLLFHVDWSSDPSRGLVELYGDLDGNGLTQLLPPTHMFTMKMDPVGATLPVGARLGIYRDRAIAGDATAYFDGFTIATDRASAEAGAFGALADAPAPAPAVAPTPPAGNWTRPPTPPVDTSVAPARLPRTCKVPRVVHHRLRAARVMLHRAGCRARVVRRRARRHGRVLRQSIRPGRIVPAGTRVRVVVARRH